MISFVEAAPDGSDRVGCRQVEQLREVEDVEELWTVPNAEPHPISVGLQADRLQVEQFHEAGAAARPPVRVRLVLVEESGAVSLGVVIVRVGRSASALGTAATTLATAHYYYYLIIIINYSLHSTTLKIITLITAPSSIIIVIANRK